MRLGLDLGTNSIGWWLYALKDGEITSVIDGGVRIFADGRDPKTKESLAVERRIARAQRRRRDRFLRRKAALMKRMAETGLMPDSPAEAKALEALDPFALRAAGLDQVLPLTHFGRALFHLNQRRGFKSNRKTDRGDNESSKIKDASARLDQAMMARGARTYGEFLHMRRSTAPDARQVPSVRTRLTIARRDMSDTEEAGYDFYPDRRHLSDEFDRLWAAQARHYPELLSDDLRDEISTIIFHQRPLKTPEVGLCLFTDERRLPSAHPLTQRRVLYETVNALRVTARGEPARALTLDERDALIHALDNKKPGKAAPRSAKSGPNMKLAALARVIKLRQGQSFTLDTANRDAIACDPIRASLAHPDRFGPRWSSLDSDAQWDIIERIRAQQSDADHSALLDWLQQTHGLDEDHAIELARAPLPEGYARLGLTATTRILEALKSEVIPYSTAVARCGWHHSDERTGEILDQLPYYGALLTRHVIPGSYNENDDDVTRFGRITNPTVHIGLNQLRRLVNRIITTYGKPDEIVVEVARELKRSDEQRRDYERQIKKNTEAAKKRGEKLVNELGQADTGANRLILRLWEDLNPDDCMRRFCPYSGAPISAAMLFDGSCQVDHILPFSRTMDDSFANRTLCLREYNQKKRNDTPWEAAQKGVLDWNRIEPVLKYLPKNKAWRFAPDAMQKFEGENDFTARALKDTQYLSRLARAYLAALYDGEDGKSHVWVVPGRLTEMLRRHWGLNGIEALTDQDKQTVKAKNRTDHRHHAIDAAVIAATDRSLIQRISKMARRDEIAGAEDVARSVTPPWDGFRRDVAAQVQNIVVSHRANHGSIDPAARKSGRDSTAGALHQDTAFGLTGETDPRGVPLVVTRKPLLSLNEKQIARTAPGKGGMIRDDDLRQRLALATQGKTGKAFLQALESFAAQTGPYHGIRHVRMIEPLGVAPIHNGHAQARKAYATRGNHRYEVWHMPDGKFTAWVVPTFYAHKADLPQDARPATPATCLRPHPAAQRALTLQKNDMVRLRDATGKEIIATVEKFDGNGTIELIPHTESNAADRYNKDKSDNVYIRKRAGPLMAAQARRVYVDEIGHLCDPGPWFGESKQV